MLPGGLQGCGVAGAAGLGGSSSRLVLHGNELLCPLGLASHCRQRRAAGRPMALWRGVSICRAVYDLHGSPVEHVGFIRCKVPGTPADRIPDRRKMHPIFDSCSPHGLRSLWTAWGLACHGRTQLTES